MRASQWEYFKPNAKTSRYGLWCVIVPVAVMIYLVKGERDGKEHLYRTGQVSYRDRTFKFV